MPWVASKDGFADWMVDFVTWMVISEKLLDADVTAFNSSCLKADYLGHGMIFGCCSWVA